MSTSRRAVVDEEHERARFRIRQSGRRSSAASQHDNHRRRPTTGARWTGQRRASHGVFGARYAARAARSPSLIRVISPLWTGRTSKPSSSLRARTPLSRETGHRTRPPRGASAQGLPRCQPPEPRAPRTAMRWPNPDQKERRRLVTGLRTVSAFMARAGGARSSHCNARSGRAIAPAVLSPRPHASRFFSNLPKARHPVPVLRRPIRS